MSNNHQINNLQSPSIDSPLFVWLHYLENLHAKAIDLGLERAKWVGEKLNILKPAPTVITVGGTNGKGTTCRTLEMILLEAGFKVGVYSSPHLIRYNERVRIDGMELPDEKHVEAFCFIENGRADTSLTYFEFGTLSALHLFQQAALDVVILEVGLGGRLDSCNIVDADIAVITSIDIDHIDWLGDNRDDIAREKAGIFRPYKPAVVGEPNIPQTLIDEAIKIEASLYELGQVWHFTQEETYWSWSGPDLQINQLPYPNVPVQNAATALATLYASGFINRADDKRITQTQISQALQKTSLTGRFEIKETQTVEIEGVKQIMPRIILDVAHNPHAANYLYHQIINLKKTVPANTRFHFIMGMLHDKDIQNTLKPLLPIVNHWHFISLNVPRGADANTLQSALNNLCTETTLPQTIVDVHQSVETALKSIEKQEDKHDIIVICGSFYTVAQYLMYTESEMN